MKYLVLVCPVSRTAKTMKVAERDVHVLATRCDCIAICLTSERAIARAAKYNREQAN